MMKKRSDSEKTNLSILPYIVLSTIDGKEHKFIMDKDKIIIGRLNDLNDISLQPDPHQLVTRYMHCSIETKNCSSWIVDNASKNGTFIENNKIIQRVKGEVRLQDNDKILILGDVKEDGKSVYWELLYKDPLATTKFEKSTPVLVYDWIQAKLFINTGDEQIVVSTLTPMEHKLIRCMDQRNKSNGNIPVMCTYDELISALWDDGYSHTMNDVNHLVQGLRKKIESDFRNPVFLVNIRGMGYRLITNYLQ